MVSRASVRHGAKLLVPNDVRIAAKEQLLATRNRELQTMLHPLSQPTNPARCKRANIDSHNMAIAAYIGDVSGRSYRDWTFATHNEKIFCQFFELWRLEDTTREYVLLQAYLSLHIVGKNPRPLLAVHCDPFKSKVASTSASKLAPHLHVEQADLPIPKCHFALNYGHLADVLESLESLTNAMSSAIGLLNEEVLKRTDW